MQQMQLDLVQLLARSALSLHNATYYTHMSTDASIVPNTMVKLLYFDAVILSSLKFQSTAASWAKPPPAALHTSHTRTNCWRLQELV